MPRPWVIGVGKQRGHGSSMLVGYQQRALSCYSGAVGDCAVPDGVRRRRRLTDWLTGRPD
jgi:hypothetical protein